MNRKMEKIVKFFSVLIVIAAIEGLTSCEKYTYNPPAVDPSATWHFTTDIQPIFTLNCIACHNGTRAPDLRDGKSYQALTKGSYVTTPAENSRLYLKMTSSDHSDRSKPEDKLKVLYWITQGAKNN